MKLACLMQHRQKYQVKIVMEVSGSKAEKRKYQDIWKSEIPVTTLCIVMFAERQARILLAKLNLLLKKKSLNVKVLFFLIKV
jgi:hypothetical protein